MKWMERGVICEPSSECEVCDRFIFMIAGSEFEQRSSVGSQGVLLGGTDSVRPCC